MPHLIGERVMLREYRLEDLVPLRAWVNDSRIVGSLSDDFLFPHTLEASEAYLNAMMDPKPDCRGFVIADADTQLYIGEANLHTIDWKNRVGRIGIVIGSVDKLGQGFGTEAMKLLMAFAFREMNLNRLELEVYDDNERAYRSYLRCGFKEEGRLRERQFKNGAYVDVIQMGLLRSEWVASL
ncbi:GNAT family protein [Cohnella lubricantis]|uniref:GNAT family N-acetyltransferase n=1 Tax=Cohnella lubricantis TaxID=2163172 RepID=A0A841TCG3_9BACL|nr:GNAT family protein [Cohnella lubricantis]MBB6676141.1 GNAT family N-acetyltransferase [Cohnella lubricantis]MBP2118667.1 RimJ/RimL family protein N-acetyltransferase [Cohnella lubricantis]